MVQCQLMPWLCIRFCIFTLVFIIHAGLASAENTAADDSKGERVTSSMSSMRVPDTPQSSNVLAYPADYYAVQIVAVKTKSQILDLLQQYDLGDPPYGLMKTPTGSWYVLLLGVYPDYETAKAARDSLPAGLLKLNPWIRKMGTLQAAIRAAFPKP